MIYKCWYSVSKRIVSIFNVMIYEKVFKHPLGNMKLIRIYLILCDATTLASILHTDAADMRSHFKMSSVQHSNHNKYTRSKWCAGWLFGCHRELSVCCHKNVHYSNEFSPILTINVSLIDNKFNLDIFFLWLYDSHALQNGTKHWTKMSFCD